MPFGQTRKVAADHGPTLLTWEKNKGLMAGAPAVDTPPVGTTSLMQWACAHAPTLGKSCTSEPARIKDRKAKYASN
jgi:hypothetical protein